MAGFEQMPWLTAAEQQSLRRGELSTGEHLNLEKLARNQSFAKSFLFGDKKIATAVGQAKDVDFRSASAVAKGGCKDHHEGPLATVSSGGDFTAQAVL